MLKLVRRHGSAFLYMRGTVRGICVDESTGVKHGQRRFAEEIRARRQTELLEESIHGRRAVATFSQAALSYIDQGGKQGYRIEDIIKHFGTTKLAKIGAAEIHAGAKAVFRTMQPASRRTHFYIPVSAILSHAHSLGWCNKITFDWPAANEGVYRWLTKEEAHRFISEGRHIKRVRHQIN